MSEASDVEQLLSSRMFEAFVLDAIQSLARWTRVLDQEDASAYARRVGSLLVVFRGVRYDVDVVVSLRPEGGATDAHN